VPHKIFIPPVPALFITALLGLTAAGSVASPAQAKPPAQAPSVELEVDGYGSVCATVKKMYARCWDLGWTDPGVLDGDALWAAPGGPPCLVTTSSVISCGGFGDGVQQHGQANPPPDLGAIKKLSIGWRHVCALKTDATVRCWGYAGDGATTPPADLINVSDLEAGPSSTCAVLINKTLRCWGFQVNTQAPLDLGPIKKVSIGWGTVCALNVSNRVRCWGDNWSGQSGAIPTDMGDVKDLSTGDGHSCAIDTVNAVRCWGWNAYGQTDVPSDLGAASAVAVGYHVSCAVIVTEAIRCWRASGGGILYQAPKLVEAPLINQDSPSKAHADTNLSFTSTTPGAIYSCSVDGLEFERCSSPISLTHLLAGDHSLRVRALNPINMSSRITEHSWTVAGPNPGPASPTAVGVPILHTSTRSVRVRFKTANPSDSIVMCRLDSEPEASCTDGLNRINLAVASHKLQAVTVRKSDGARSKPFVHIWLITKPVPRPAATGRPAGMKLVGRPPANYWDITLGNSFVSSEPTSATNLKLVEISSELRKPNDDASPPVASNPRLAEYRSRHVKWVGRHPHWTRVANRAGKWSIWIAIKG